MNLTISLSEQNAAALKAQSRAARVPPEHYLAQTVARVLEGQCRRDAENLGKHLDYMASQVPRRRPRKKWKPPFKKP